MARTENSYFKNDYTFTISGNSLAYADSHPAITANAISVIEYLSDFISWRGELDFVVFFDGPVKFGPNKIFEYPAGNGHLLAYGGTTPDGNTYAQHEAITGDDANGSDFDLGLYLLPNVDGTLTNYGIPLFFDPSPDAYNTPEIPSGTHDFFSIFLHEVLHGMAFWSSGQHAGFPNSSFDDLTVERNGQFYFEGESVMTLLGQGLPLATTGSRDHYGSNRNGDSPIDRGAMYEWGNYELNRWHLGQLELAVLEDLGYEVANQGALPLVEQPDSHMPVGEETDTLSGGPGNDTLEGGSGSDTTQALGSDDTITGSAGNDQIDGGAGVDTVLYSGDQSGYTLTLSPTSTTVTDRRSDGNGTDTLIDMELLDFDSGHFDPFDLRTFGGPAGLDPVDLESFIELYIAYFNRAPDAIGLNFWGTSYANGTSLQEMATLFADQPEALAAYPEGTTNLQFATTVYNNVLGRTPDQSGLDFWVGQLDSGSVTKDQFILEVLGGVQTESPDRSYLDNKVDIGAYFAVHKGMSDTDNASAAMALFDGTEASINTAVTAIDGYYADALDPTTGEFLMQVVGVLDDPFAIA